ncbi:MAG TPA: bacteriohopanetetrol glucosamine biosynthesis glycosyltransferase HpnI, partial [Candidatus Eisenbacteria bacterium]|nr:bacteriohopanetetrol glucosamine biosynthesis glycosyltransferase HpnI [Candidatus Eisenbacteria bacterium]
MMVWRLLLLVGAAGLVTSTGYLVLVMIAGARFRRAQRRAEAAPQAFPPVTLLKPVCGMEPGLEEHLTSFFEQHYPSYEIIFGARHEDDPALDVARRISRRYPSVPVTIVTTGEPWRPNAKVCSLVKMYERASHDYLIISDSDVTVEPNYIADVVQPMLDTRNGMVTCLYRGRPTGGLWSKLEALGMSVEMTSGAIVANLVEGMKFALGPTMAIRRDALEAIGGFEPLAEYCSDDYVLGRKVAESGRQVVMSQHVIDHVVINRKFACSMQHQIRWMKSTRFSRRAGHAGTALTFAMPFGLMGLLAAGAMHHWALGAGLFAAAYLNRVALSLVAGWGVVADQRALRMAWLYPLRDLMGFAFWCASYTGRTIVWRGDWYRLEECG